MNNSKKDLRVFGYLYLIMAAIDLAGLAAFFIKGDLDPQTVAEAAGNFALALAAILFVIAIILFFTLLKLFVGLDILHFADGKKAAPNVKMAVILLVIHVISLKSKSAGTMELISKPADTAIAVAEAVVMVLYLLWLKKKKNS